MLRYRQATAQQAERHSIDRRGNGWVSWMTATVPPSYTRSKGRRPVFAAGLRSILATFGLCRPRMMTKRRFIAMLTSLQSWSQHQGEGRTKDSGWQAAGALLEGVVGREALGTSTRGLPAHACTVHTSNTQSHLHPTRSSGRGEKPGKCRSEKQKGSFQCQSHGSSRCGRVVRR